MRRVSWPHFETKYDTTCGRCGLSIMGGEAVYGTTDKSFVSGKKGWFIVCRQCYERGIEEKDASSVAGEIERMADGTVSVFSESEHMPKPRTDFDDFIDSMSAKGHTGVDGMPPVPSTKGKRKRSVKDKKTTMEKPIEAPEAPQPWSLQWLRENAEWGV